MADEIVGIKLQVDGSDAEQTVGELREAISGIGEGAKKAGVPFGSLRSQLKGAIENLQQMQAQFGDISPEAQKAAKAVAGLRDAIKDAREVSDLFDPEKKFQAVVGVAQGIASGFAAAQGAMALFGVQSEAVEKSILKVQAAMSLAQGLSGIKAATEDFVRLASVVKNLSVVQALYNFVMNGTATATVAATVATTGWATALRVLRAALVSTGLGAIVVLIGTAIAQLMKAADATDDFVEALARADKEAQDFANSTSDAIVAMYQRQSEIAVATAQAQGKSAKEVYEIQKKYLDMIARERHANVENQKNDNLDASDASKKAADADTASKLAALNQQAKDLSEANQKAKEAREKAAADSKAAKDKEDALEEERLREKQENIKTLSDLFTQSVAAQDQADKDAVDRKKERDSQFDAYQNELLNKRIDAQNQAADASKQIAKQESDYRIAMAQNASNALMGFAALAGEQTTAGKVLAIASATIAMYSSAQQAYWAAFNPVPTPASPVLGALFAAGAIATGLANIRKIAAVQVPGGGSTSIPTTGGAAPLAPQAPNIQTTRIDSESINNIGNATVPARAYVLEQDITNSQVRAERLRRAARFE